MSTNSIARCTLLLSNIAIVVSIAVLVIEVWLNQRRKCSCIHGYGSLSRDPQTYLTDDGGGELRLVVSPL